MDRRLSCIAFVVLAVLLTANPMLSSGQEDVVRAAEAEADRCRVEPRPPAEYVRIASTPIAEGEPELPGAVASEADLPSGEPADAATAAAAERAVRELVACLNAGDLYRSMALLDEGTVRWAMVLLTGEAPTAAELAEVETAVTELAAASLEPPARADRIVLHEIHDVRRLPDGRVGVIVVLEDPAELLVELPFDAKREGAKTVFLAFQSASGQWLVERPVLVGD